MAVHIEGLLEKSLSDKIKDCNILVVGAGGIGCELLKNLVLTGFENITVVDLDTIELSNLNRQFLFHKQHIGRPKSIVAKESVLKFNPKANITAIHDSITNSKYDIEFFHQFSLVTNALDNVVARSHVNRMCLSAKVPLVESGSAGYLGQVTVYKKKETECFDCLPRKKQTTYASCTIRNTPSEPVHCIVWAKHLFNQLFGEADDENQVSPDLTDPELGLKANDAGNVERINFKEWAKNANYDPAAIFKKLFNDDIVYLNEMNNLWEKRKRPITLDWNTKLPETGVNIQEIPMKDHTVWSLKQCKEVFASTVEALKKQSESTADSILTWDKDDDVAMDFVVACSNLRSCCFHIDRQTRFNAKAIAGNIIPAIASTNAVISGLIVLQAMKVLQGDISKCRTAWLNESSCAGKILSSTQLEKPNPNCYACREDTQQIKVKLNMDTLIVKTLGEKLLKEKLLMVQPSITEKPSGRIFLSGDPEESEDDDEMAVKTLSSLKVTTSSHLHCEDNLQSYQVIIIVNHDKDMVDQEFEIESDVTNMLSQMRDENDVILEKSDSEKTEDCPVLEVDEIEMVDLSVKKKLSEDIEDLPPAKRVKTVE